MPNGISMAGKNYWPSQTWLNAVHSSGYLNRPRSLGNLFKDDRRKGPRQSWQGPNEMKTTKGRGLEVSTGCVNVMFERETWKRGYAEDERARPDTVEKRDRGRFKGLFSLLFRIVRASARLLSSCTRTSAWLVNLRLLNDAFICQRIRAGSETERRRLEVTTCGKGMEEGEWELGNGRDRPPERDDTREGKFTPLWRDGVLYRNQ